MFMFTAYQGFHCANLYVVQLLTIFLVFVVLNYTTLRYTNPLAGWQTLSIIRYNIVIHDGSQVLKPETYNIMDAFVVSFASHLVMAEEGMKAK